MTLHPHLKSIFMEVLEKRRDKAQKDLARLTTIINKLEDIEEGYGRVVKGYKCFKCGNSIIKIRAMPHDLWKCKKCDNIMNPFDYLNLI